MKRILIPVMAMVLTSMTLPGHAGVMAYKISQDGWSVPGFPNIPSGGRIFGSFSGEDLNHDGFIELEDGEVNSYLVKFVDSLFTPDFTHTLDNLSFFRYDLGSVGFPPSFPLFSSGNGLGYDADDRVIFGPVGCSAPDCVYVESTSQPAFVTRISEPTILSLMAFGVLFFLGASFAGRRAPAVT